MSQFELALQLDVSQRHVSYVESDRAKPSMDLLLNWLRTTDASVSVANAILTHAGYAGSSLYAPHGEQIRQKSWDEMRMTISLHDPSPGFIFSSDWMICEVNRASHWLIGLLMGDYLEHLGAGNGSIDMIDALADPRGLFSKMKAPQQTAYQLLRQLRAEEWARPDLRRRVDVLETSLESRFQVSRIEPISIPSVIAFETQFGKLEFIRSQSLHSLPQDVNISMPRTELWYPYDDLTKRLFTRGRNDRRP